MARGEQLQQLVLKLRLELGRDPSSGQGQQELTKFKYALKHAQEELYENHDWEFLSIHRDESLVAGSRYYSFDSDLNFERVSEAKIKVNGSWYPVKYGIDSHDYNAYDSSEDERSNWVKKWDSYEGDQYEVWPIPDANDQTLRFYGTKVLSPLVADTDRADLDDLLIVLTAASALSSKENDIVRFATRAEQRLHRLKAEGSKLAVANMAGKRHPTHDGRIRITHIH